MNSFLLTGMSIVCAAYVVGRGTATSSRGLKMTDALDKPIKAASIL